MLKNVLIPEKIGSYYLVSKRVLGLDIGKSHVRAIQVMLRGRTITTEKVFQEAVENGTTPSNQEKIVEALRVIMGQAHKKCVIHTALPSNLMVFKTLRLPFVDREKIAMIINYEIEPLLPFAASDALVDFIITKIHPEDSSSEVLVAAVQKHHVIQHLDMLAQAGIDPEVVTVDMFNLYALYERVPTYQKHMGGVALVDMGFTHTTIAYIFNRQLRMIRSLPRGMNYFAKQVHQDLSISIAESFDLLQRFGLEPNNDLAYSESINKIMSDFVQEIQFTLTSFSSKDTERLELIVLIGDGAVIKNIERFMTQFTGVRCESFEFNGLFTSQVIKNKLPSIIHNSFAQSLANALPSSLTEQSNLRQKEFVITDTRTFVQQLAVGGVLTVLLVGILGFNYWQRTRLLSHEIQTSQQEIIRALKQHFVLSQDNDLEELIVSAEEKVKKEEQMWFAFSGQARSSFLKYLLALHALDKEGLGLVVDRLDISRGILTLKARVKDYDALRKLEKDLKQSPLFSSIEPQEKTDFTMRITLAKNGGE
ncbi:pilus assembly protein PilM [Candidatus Dependentiae bacterium]|nr:pilus assembly protein PilM [Candidatus Dependentiae bacterium]